MQCWGSGGTPIIARCGDVIHSSQPIFTIVHFRIHAISVTLNCHAGNDKRSCRESIKTCHIASRRAFIGSGPS